jgi:curved DNA-binding protein
MADKNTDYYQTLGVARDATAEEIKLGFRKLARLHHPDVAKDKVAGEAMFKRINAAYEVLGDPEKRRYYDEEVRGVDTPRRAASGSGGTNPGAAGFAYAEADYEDMFERFFREPTMEGRTGPQRARPGEDVEAELLVTLEEAHHGVTRRFSLRRSGAQGQGEHTETYQMRVPPGVSEGTQIRLAGRGAAGHVGGAPGNLLLRVRLAPHPRFTVEGDDLHGVMDIAPWEAVLGAQVSWLTLDGKTAVRVPPNSEAGSVLRLRGLGLSGEGKKRGDIYLSLRVVVPSTTTPEERAIWEELAGKSGFKPRGG